LTRGSFFHRSWLSEGINGTGFAFGIGEAGIVVKETVVFGVQFLRLHPPNLGFLLSCSAIQTKRQKDSLRA
jgi:hypothetical protein